MYLEEFQKVCLISTLDIILYALSPFNLGLTRVMFIEGYQVSQSMRQE